MARNRGQKKPKLRDYSIAVLTPDESLALREVMMNYQQHPVATAILGGVAIEHELDALLRRRFKRKDDAAWESLTSDKGPFGTFAAKIIAGYAFGLYDEAVKDDLDAVRTIRNAFAHSRRLLDFNDPLIIREMLSTKILYKEGKAILRESEVSSDDAKSAYLNICFSLIIKLIQRHARALKASNKRAKARANKSPFAKALFAGSVHSLHPISPKLNPLSLPPGQTNDPKPSALSQLMGGVLGNPAKLAPDDKDK